MPLSDELKYEISHPATAILQRSERSPGHVHVERPMCFHMY